jgi:hypothetical protein
MKRTYIYTGGGIIIAVAALLALWFIFSSGTPSPATTTNSFGTSNNTVNIAPGADGQKQNQSNVPQNTSTQKIFKISDGPVAGATFVETLHPTTTLARFVMADNGHAFDLVLDAQGSVPKVLSNTTIPGATSATWVGGSAVLQYLDGNTIKTVYLGLPAPDATTTPVRVLFYPDGIVSLAASPDATKVAYELRTAAGTDGYVVKPDGTGGVKLFSLPLRQVQLRWPSVGTLLAYSNSAAGVPGIAFAVDAKKGTATPLVYAPGLTAFADATFSHVLYETTPPGTNLSFAYSHNVQTGVENILPFNLFPEKCAGAAPSTNIVYCAAPLSYVPSKFLDLWRQGSASAADSLMSYDPGTGTLTVLATPGVVSGIATDMLQIAVSPDAHYALFVSKYDRSLWGVRLTQ